MPREYRFAVDVAWDGGRRTTARIAGKQPLHIATPPEFRGTDPDVWSPEDALVAAAGSCLAVTIVALAATEAVPLYALEVHAEGVVGRRDDGSLGFVALEQIVDLETESSAQDDAQALVAKAEESCLVSVSLALPVRTVVNVHAPHRVA